MRMLSGIGLSGMKMKMKLKLSPVKGSKLELEKLTQLMDNPLTFFLGKLNKWKKMKTYLIGTSFNFNVMVFSGLSEKNI